jgi:hypothetical protein
MMLSNVVVAKLVGFRCCIVLALSIIAMLESFSCDNTPDVLDYIVHDPFKHFAIKEALLALKVDDTMGIDELRRVIRAAAVAKGGDKEHKAYYKALAELGDKTITSCPSETLIICCASIIRREQLARFRVLVESSADRFRACAEKVSIQLRNSFHKDIIEFTSLERFFRAALNSKRTSADEYLKELANLDMVKDRMNADSMTRVALKYYDKLQYISSFAILQTPLDFIKNFLDDRCLPFKVVLADRLNSINAALLFGRQPFYDYELELMNEYNRICNVWGNLRANILDNIKRRYEFIDADEKHFAWKVIMGNWVQAKVKQGQSYWSGFFGR